jgi:hypothetical protein
MPAIGWTGRRSKMSLNVAAADRAIAERVERHGRFTIAELRADLNLGPDSPEAKNLSNRVHRLYKKMGVLKNDGINERNMAYVFVNDKKFAAFKRGFGAAQMAPAVPQATTGEPPIKKLARLAEFDDVRTTIAEMAEKVDRIDRLVRELHAGLFEVQHTAKS